MNTETLVEYAPYILIIIFALSSIKIFARSDEVRALEAKIIGILAEKYITKDMYSNNHKALQDQMLQIHQDISEVKNLLISAINRRNGKWN